MAHWNSGQPISLLMRKPRLPLGVQRRARTLGRYGEGQRSEVLYVPKRPTVTVEKLEPASLGRIIDTAEHVQGDWFAAGRTLHAQGLRELASEVEQFRQSLRTPITRHERDAATRRAHEDLSPRQLDLLR